MPDNEKPFVGVTHTFADANRINLMALIRAIEPNCPGTGREVMIQVDPLSPAGSVLVGDDHVTFAGAGVAQRCAYHLQKGDSRPYRRPAAQDLNGIYLVASAGIIVNIEVSQ
ncbi:MAG: hypothetical protein LLG20_18495 [Acidobacteriales bacterium]|nr:hypothetical protein [Terriglobales bacterium]